MYTKNRQEIRNEIILEAKENHKKFEEAKCEINDNPLWQELHIWNTGNESEVKNDA